jgi:TrpR-related protein YerC/YecD
MKSHQNLTPRQEQLTERALYSAVAALQTPDECRAFFRDLCTPAEIQAMADRWAVVDHLNRGLPYREIHKLTGVSVTTIGRVARFLASGNGGYETAAKRLQEAKDASPRA